MVKRKKDAVSVQSLDVVQTWSLMLLDQINLDVSVLTLTMPVVLMVSLLPEVQTTLVVVVTIVLLDAVQIKWHLPVGLPMKDVPATLLNLDVAQMDKLLLKDTIWMVVETAQVLNLDVVLIHLHLHQVQMVQDVDVQVQSMDVALTVKPLLLDQNLMAVERFLGSIVTCQRCLETANRTLQLTGSLTCNMVVVVDSGFPIVEMNLVEMATGLRTRKLVNQCVSNLLVQAGVTCLKWLDLAKVQIKSGTLTDNGISVWNLNMEVVLVMLTTLIVKLIVRSLA
jgi:hypothetical protein